MDLRQIFAVHFSPPQYEIVQEENISYKKGPHELPRKNLKAYALTDRELKDWMAETLAQSWGILEIYLSPYSRRSDINVLNFNEINQGGLWIGDLPYSHISNAKKEELTKVFRAIFESGAEKISLDCEDIADQVSGVISSTILEILTKILPQSNVITLNLMDPIRFDEESAVPHLYEFVEALNQSQVVHFGWRGDIQICFSSWNKERTLNYLSSILKEEELAKLSIFWDEAQVIR